MRQRGTQRFLMDEGKDFSSRPALPLFCGGKNRFHVKAVLGGLFFANTPDFIHNVIIRHGKTPLKQLLGGANDRGLPIVLPTDFCYVLGNYSICDMDTIPG